MFRVIPANECFIADHGAFRQSAVRLKWRRNCPSRKQCLSLVSAPDGARPNRQARGERFDTSATAGLSAVHCGVGVAEQLLHVVSVILKDCDSDTRAHGELVLTDGLRNADRVQQLTGDQAGVVWIRNFWQTAPNSSPPNRASVAQPADAWPGSSSRVAPARSCSTSAGRPSMPSKTCSASRTRAARRGDSRPPVIESLSVLRKHYVSLRPGRSVVRTSIRSRWVGVSLSLHRVAGLTPFISAGAPLDRLGLCRVPPIAAARGGNWGRGRRSTSALVGAHRAVVEVKVQVADGRAFLVDDFAVGVIGG